MVTHSGSGEESAALVQEILSALPAGCTWLTAVVDDAGAVTDFRIGAASDQGHDIYGRSGAERVGAFLSHLYPGMVGGPLWRVYEQVALARTAAEMPGFQYEEKRAGVVASSVFDVSVHPALDGLLVWWRRVDEDRRRLDHTEALASLGWAEYDLITGRSVWSPGMYRIFERDPALGPMSRAEQAAAMVPEDSGQSETAWQTLDSGAMSDVTVRFRTASSVKHLRILSDVARDAAGDPVKIYAVVQDVTTRENSRTEVQRLSDTLRTREMTSLAEHRLAGQLQALIQPIPREPLALAGAEAIVVYAPAESAVRVGGDWYHAGVLGDGRVVLAIGDLAGHGLEAASGMAHLRFGLIAWLAAGITEPGRLLELMNTMCADLDITGTAIVGILDPDTRTLTWARAGHMAPLLARAGIVAPLDRPPGVLLGAVPGTGFPTAQTRLECEDLLLLYTDGLVERRVEDGGRMLQRVSGSLAAASVTGGRPDLEQLAALAAYASPDDDTCVLAVRILPVGSGTVGGTPQ